MRSCLWIVADLGGLFRAHVAAAGGLRPPSDEPRSLGSYTTSGDASKCVRWGVCETGCPAGAKASFDLAFWPHATVAGAKLVTGARVRRIASDGQGRADAVLWIDRTGHEHRQKAKVVVLAANGIGTARLLLLSASKAFPDGLANRSGLVGRNLMLHPNNEALGLYDEPIESWKGPAGQLIYSLEFYETDRSRGFLRGSKINLMPVPGILRLLFNFAHLPFDERWGAAVHDITEHAGRALSWAGNIENSSGGRKPCHARSRSEGW